MTRAWVALVVASAAIASADACRSRSHGTPPDDLTLAIAASESLTTAITDSLTEVRYAVSQQGNSYSDPSDTLNACSDRVDGREWEFFTSSIVDLQLPSDFSAATESNGRAEWRGGNGNVVASGKKGWTGLITSSCDVYISGFPARLYALNALDGKAVHLTIHTTSGDIDVHGQARSTYRQAELLHAFRYSRVSSSWGRQ